MSPMPTMEHDVASLGDESHRQCEAQSIGRIIRLLLETPLMWLQWTAILEKTARVTM
jgi:hypothetical protein